MTKELINSVKEYGSIVHVLELVANSEGHRSGYIATLNMLYNIKILPFGSRETLTCETVLIPLIEESFGRYLVICLIRSLLGRRTVGFLFRPRPALDGKSWRLRAKRCALKILRLLPNIRTLSILPFSVEPRLSTIADDWIYDFESWDITGDSLSPPPHNLGPLGREIARVAEGRKVCCAIGRQDSSKGFDQFANIYKSSPKLRSEALFAFGGVLSEDMVEISADFVNSGGFAFPHFITDEQLLDLYACSDVIWCVYSPEYDQASGIFGRAMQLGLPVVVRKGSMIHRQSEIEGVESIAFDETTDLTEFSRTFPSKDPQAARNRALLQRRESIRRLSNALGVQSRSDMDLQRHPYQN